MATEEQKREWRRQWRMKYPERQKAVAKKWNAANPNYLRDFYKNNRETILRQRKENARRNHSFLTWLKLGVPCMDCNLSFEPVAMDFDHVRGEKKIKLGQVGANTHSVKSILLELEKCEIVCANCHRVRTAARRQNGSRLQNDS